jgi:hypothetical protein
MVALSSCSVSAAVMLSDPPLPEPWLSVVTVPPSLNSMVDAWMSTWPPRPSRRVWCCWQCPCRPVGL